MPRRAGRFVVAVARRFYADQCLMRASALAYTSLLSIVPLLAVMFAVLKGLGVQARLEGILLARLSLNQETTDLIIGYIDRTNFGTLGALGAATLILTVISVLGTIEASFNSIWRVTTARSYWREVTDYLSVILLTPFLLLAAVTITSLGQVQRLMQWVLQSGYLGVAALQALRLSPIAINILALGILYAVMPNRRPAWRPIIASSLVAGTAWYVVQLAYVALQFGVARNNAIYGALAQLPVTLVWLYVSWVVVLAGAELAAVLEFGPRALLSGAIDRQAVALHILVRAADAFADGKQVDVIGVAKELAISVEVVESVAAALQKLGWVRATDVAPPALMLARPADSIGLGRLSSVAEGAYMPVQCDGRVRAALAELRAEHETVADRHTLAEVLAARVESQPATAAQPRAARR
jgi:membrane protein